MNGGACLTLYCVGVVVLIHTIPLGVPRVGLTVAAQEAAVSAYGRSFFFFQAEDGIRDLTVTGVQTCALPISALPPAPLDGARGRLAIGAHRRARGAGGATSSAWAGPPRGRGGSGTSRSPVRDRKSVV